MQKGRKTILVILCLMVYTISVCGVTINKHFCGGELESVTFLKKSNCCSEETEDESSDCCQDESIYVANNGETLSTTDKPVVNPVFIPLADVIPGEVNLQTLETRAHSPYYSSRGKPPSKGPDLSFIMVFRI